MTSPPPDGRALLAVFAHPDDESIAAGGLLAWCAALGVRVTTLSLTHGEQGRSAEPGASSGTFALGDLRAQELRAAARELGIEDVRVLNHADGMLPWLDAARLERDIERAIRDTGAEVVVTFDEDGLYWHPDHVAVHEHTTAAVAALGSDAPALYYVSMPPGAMRTVVDEAADRFGGDTGQGRPPRSILGVEDAGAFGAFAAAPTLVLDTGDFARRKLRALACHRTQRHDCALGLIPEEEAARLLGVEHYRRADVGAQGPSFLDRLPSRAPAPR